jgi:hypothetical protein
MMAHILSMRLLIGSTFGIFSMLLVYLSEALVLLSVRYWWIWSCNFNDQFFIVNIKIKFSTIVQILSLVVVCLAIIIVKFGFEIDNTEYFNMVYAWPMLGIAGMINTVNVARLIKLYIAWYKVFKHDGKP